MPTTHEDKTCSQIDEDAIEEMTFDGSGYDKQQIRKFMRKTGISIDLKPKEWNYFDKNLKLNSLTYAMMALTGSLNKNDLCIEFDAEHMHFGQDDLVIFTEQQSYDAPPISLALMATNTENLLFQRYQMSLESLEVMLKTHEKNEYAWGDKYEQMEYDLKVRDLKLEEKQKELDQVLKERDDFKVKLEKWSNASVLQNEVLNKQRYVSDKSCIGFGIESSNSMESDISSGDETLTDSTYENFKREKAYKAVPPPTGTIIPPRANVSFTGIDELAIRNKVVNQEKTNTSQSAIDRNKVIIEDWVDSDDEETDISESQKETVFNTENSEESFENRAIQQKISRTMLSLTVDALEKKECLILSPKFKFVDEDLVILRAPRKNDVYSLDLKNIIPSGGITCLVAKATEG
ncbi:hypothetical protein Tco_0277868 [Tanacetum coccineum]